jgi:hypothetical protein
MRMIAALCGCTLVAAGCVASPFEPSRVDLPHHYANTRLGASDAAPPAERGIDAQAIARASGSTPEDFVDHGWFCGPSIVPGRIVCLPPQHTFPVRAVPPDLPPADRPMTVRLLAWDNGVFAGVILLIRPEVYAGQPCSSTGQAYDYRSLIGYYECVHKLGPRT